MFIKKTGNSATAATRIYYVPSVIVGCGVFSPFLCYFFYFVCMPTKGGEPMDEDDILYEMFLELTAKLDADDSDGRMRILSQNPRYAEDDLQTTKNNTQKR